jgi:hypothetical protein
LYCDVPLLAVSLASCWACGARCRKNPGICRQVKFIFFFLKNTAPSWTFTQRNINRKAKRDQALGPLHRDWSSTAGAITPPGRTTWRQDDARLRREAAEKASDLEVEESPARRLEGPPLWPQITTANMATVQFAPSCSTNCPRHPREELDALLHFDPMPPWPPGRRIAAP